VVDEIGDKTAGLTRSLLIEDNEAEVDRHTLFTLFRTDLISLAFCVEDNFPSAHFVLAGCLLPVSVTELTPTHVSVNRFSNAAAAHIDVSDDASFLDCRSVA
jgi:hypothetical protein